MGTLSVKVLLHATLSVNPTYPVVTHFALLILLIVDEHNPLQSTHSVLC